MFNNPYNMYSMNMPSMGAIGLNRGFGPIGTSSMGLGSNFGMNNMMGANIARTTAKPGFFKTLAGIKWGNVLTNTQKTLNVINQAIPVYYQIKPIYNNLKSFGKIMSVFNEPTNNNTNKNIDTNNTLNNNYTKENNKKENSNQPTFFIN